MSFKTIEKGTLTYLAADTIPVPHAFTTRLGGVSRDHLASLNLAFGHGDTMENVETNLRILTGALGIREEKLVLTRQTHSDIVRRVSAADAVGLCHRDYPECDALVTNDPGTALLVFTADCTPILLWDSETGAVGAAHAGWRGTAAGIAAKTVEAMVKNFGSRPENIHAAIGPNLAQCCFETDADVPEAMYKALGKEAEAFIQRRGEKFHVDLKGLNRLWLNQAGVSCVDISQACTACRQDLFWSHRATRGVRGSQGAMILCKEGRV